LTRYEKQQDYHEYVETALEYVVKYNSSDYVLIEKIAMFYEDSNVDTPIEEVIELTKNAIANQGGTRHQLYDALANLYFQNKNKRKALNTIKKAKELAILNNADTFSIDNLHNRIKAL
jgi:FMN phosphatase YigB (HAD superfamily)